MKNGNKLKERHLASFSQYAGRRAVVELLEGRRLLSAVADIPNLSGNQGLLLPNGERLLVSFGDLVAISPDGTFDASFGNNGRATIPGMEVGAGPTDVFVNPIAIAPDGDILVAGSVSGGGAVARFHPDGSIDSSFGNGGVATMQLGSESLGFFALAFQPDGKFVAVGESFVQTTPVPTGQFAVARFNDDGSPDLSFNSTGVVSVALSTAKDAGTVDLADTVAFEADGRILVGGTAAFTNEPIEPPSGFGLIRLNTDGTLDQTFGAGGKVLTYFGSASGGLTPTLNPAQLASLFVRKDGTILAVGEGNQLQIMVAVYNDDGSLDTSYGVGGRVQIIATSGSAEYINLHSDGGFDVMRINIESVVWDKVDAAGHWLEGPATPIDPTPPAEYDQAPSNGSTTPDPGTTDPTPIDSGPTVTDLPVPVGHFTLRKPALPRVVAGKLFSGSVTTVTGISQALSQSQATIDWGDGSTPTQANLAAVANRPALTTLNSNHQYATPGVYHLRVTLTVENVTRTLNRTLHVMARTPNGRTVRAAAGEAFTRVIGHVSADVLALNADITAAYITLDWGDGTNASTGIARKHGDGYDIIGTHTYEAHGQYRVIAKRGITSGPGISIDYSPPVVFVSLVSVL